MCVISPNSFLSGWQKRVVREKNRSLPKDTTRFLICLGFITNSFTDIARNDDRDDLLYITIGSSAEHEIAWVYLSKRKSGSKFVG